MEDLCPMCELDEISEMCSACFDEMCFLCVHDHENHCYDYLEQQDDVWWLEGEEGYV